MNSKAFKRASPLPTQKKTFLKNNLAAHKLPDNKVTR